MQIPRIRRVPRAAREIEALLTPAVLSGILIGGTWSILGAAVGYGVCEWFWPGRGTAISIPAMTFLLIVFSEISPKRLAVRFTGEIGGGLPPAFSIPSG